MRSVLYGVGAVTLMSGLVVGSTTARSAAALAPAPAPTHATVRAAVHPPLHPPAPVRADPAVVVSPGFPHGWDVVTNKTAGGPYTTASSNPLSTASHLFREGPGTPPIGEGSLQMSVGPADNSRVAALPPGLAGSELSSVLTVVYDTFLTHVSVHGAAPVAFKLGVTSANLHRFTTLVFEPAIQPGHPAVRDVWQAWNALAGEWFATGVTGLCSASQPCSFVQLKNLVGASSVILIPYFEVGASGASQTGTTCALDRVVINHTTFDLEAEQRAAPVVPPAGKPEVPVTG